MFASSDWTVPPDMMILAKALTNGTCAAACVLVGQAIVDTFDRSDAILVHAETAAGAAISCAAINATLSEMTRLDVTGLASQLSRSLDEELRELVSGTPGVDGFTGVGAFRTVHVSDPSGNRITAGAVPDLVDAVRREGTVVHPGVGGVQLVPPLVYTADDTAEAVAAVARGVSAWRDSGTDPGST